MFHDLKKHDTRTAGVIKIVNIESVTSSNSLRYSVPWAPIRIFLKGIMPLTLKSDLLEVPRYVYSYLTSTAFCYQHFQIHVEGRGGK